MLMLFGSVVGLLAFLFVLFVLLELGRRLGRRFANRGGAEAVAGFGTIESAVLALLGLIIAFTFSGAKARFDARRELIVQEANAAGTAALRLDLVPEPARAALRNELRAYLDARLAVSRGDAAAAAVVGEMQASLWRGAVDATRGNEALSSSLLVLPALNDLFDAATARTAAAQTHMAPIVFLMLVVLALISAVLAGFGMGTAPRRSWLHVWCFTGALLLVVAVIVDLEFPRRGLIRLDPADEVLVQVRDTLR